MQTLGQVLNEDSNQFGPGTDLVLALVALLFVIVTLSEQTQRRVAADGGAFKVASHAFAAADFRDYPVVALADRPRAEGTVRQIVDEYRGGEQRYPFMFIIGHANVVDARDAADRSDGARRERNWIYSSRRAALVGRLLQEHLKGAELDRLVLVSAGEFDLRDPSRPTAGTNACVEVVFGKEWKMPARNGLTATPNP